MNWQHFALYRMRVRNELLLKWNGSPVEELKQVCKANKMHMESLLKEATDLAFKINLLEELVEYKMSERQKEKERIQSNERIEAEPAIRSSTKKKNRNSIKKRENRK
jgi:hypothetical protein